jgi:hypothetical protein
LGGKSTSDEFIEMKLLRSRDLNDAIHRRALGDSTHRTSDIVSRHGLYQHGRKADFGAVTGGIRDALDELETLRRVHD